jgi:hypothetical protein
MTTFHGTVFNRGWRSRFGGPVSYASPPLEGVDWSRFDIIDRSGLDDSPPAQS